MTSAKIISVKLPMKIFRAIPSAHNGRSRFINSALEERIQRQEAEWQPTTERGRRLKASLDRGAAERGEPLDDEGIARELRERRGGLH
jgi:metal-responsive CopG/Arc/MetJ family transcriptional regulator